MSKSDIELETELTENGDDNILTPLGVYDYKELKSGRSNNKDFVIFNVSIEGNKVDKLTVIVRGSNGVLFQQDLPENMRVAGKHEWKWDGFDKNGVLDTKNLKDKLTIEFNAELGGVNKKSTVNLDNKHASEDWLDVKVNKSRNSVDVEVRVNLKDGRAEGVGEFPPQEVQNFPNYKNYPPDDPRRQRHMRLRGFRQLSMLLFAGLQKYWNRQISVNSGSVYNVKVYPILATKQAMDDIKIVYNTNREWMRSSNPGSVRGLYSLFGNFVPERVAYNVGWAKYSNGWSYRLAVDADKAFSETAAHELGHEILSAYGGDKYSYGHRGSSTVASQKTKKVANGGVTYPATGEIDLMKYYNGSRPPNFYTRVLASEQDVKSFLWLARVQFSE